jgi:hypothetical protein
MGPQPTANTELKAVVSRRLSPRGIYNFAKRNTIACCILLLVTIAGAAQAGNPNLEPGTTNVSVPTVSFELTWASADPPHYSISIDSAGRAAYQADPASKDPSQTGDPYLLKWEASQATRSRIFDLAKRARFFKGSFDSGNKRIAFSGTKTLTYMEGPRDGTQPPSREVYNQTSYNWSKDPAIQQLTEMFEGISATLVFGRKLQFDSRFDKLSLDDDLKQMETALQDNRLVELRAIAPVLRDLTQDPNVLNIARERAQRLLQSAGENTGAQPGSIAQ